MYITAGGAVAADDDDAANAVVPPSSTKDEDPYVGASVVFEGACVGLFVGGAGESAAASVLQPRCRRRAVPRPAPHSAAATAADAAAAAVPPPNVR